MMLVSGLYVYTKEKDRKFVWLKAAMEEAAGKHESAAESYRQILEDQILSHSDDDTKTGEIRSKSESGDSQVHKHMGNSCEIRYIGSVIY